VRCTESLSVTAYRSATPAFRRTTTAIRPFVRTASPLSAGVSFSSAVQPCFAASAAGAIGSADGLPVSHAASPRAFPSDWGRAVPAAARKTVMAIEALRIDSPCPLWASYRVSHGVGIAARKAILLSTADEDGSDPGH